MSVPRRLASVVDSLVTGILILSFVISTPVSAHALSRYDRYDPREHLKHALAQLRQAEKQFGPDHSNVVGPLNDVAHATANLGNYAKAEGLYKRALTIRERSMGTDHPDVAESLVFLARLYERAVKLNKSGEVEALYQRALAIREKALGPAHPDVAESLEHLANVYWRDHKPAEAETYLRRALSIREPAVGPDPLDPDRNNLARILSKLTKLCVEQGKYADAEALLRRSVTLQSHDPNAAELSFLYQLAGLYEQAGKYAEIESIYQRAVEYSEAAYGSDTYMLGDALRSLARFYVSQARYAQAEPLFERAVTIFEKDPGQRHLVLVETLEEYAACLRTAGKVKESQAKAMEMKAELIRSRQAVHPSKGQTNGRLKLQY